MLKVLIVDDEVPARDELRHLLHSIPEIQIVGEAGSATEAIASATQLQPDVIFLDISMGGVSGLEAAAILRKIAAHTMIIFATAYDEYAVKAFEVGAVDYILKPFVQERINQTIVRLKRYQQEEWKEAVTRIDSMLDTAKIQVRKLPVEKDGKIRMVSYDDIIYAYCQSGRVTIVTATGQASYNGNLGELEGRLANTNMLRVHKSYLANMDKVREVIPWFKGIYWLKLEDCPRVEIPVSKSHIKKLKAILGL